MIIDALNYMADAQESTLDVASTDVIDTLAAGDAYVGAWFCIRVDTAFTAGAGAPTATWTLQTDDTADFDSSAETLNATAALVAADMPAGAYLMKVRIPPGVKRFIRGYKTVSTPSPALRFSAGKWDMFIAADVDMNNLLTA